MPPTIDVEHLKKKQEFFSEFFENGKGEQNDLLNLLHHDKVHVLKNNKGFLSRISGVLSQDKRVYEESNLEKQIHAMKVEIAKLPPKEQLAAIQQLKQRNEDRKRQLKESLRPTTITTNSFNDSYTLNLNEQRQYMENEIAPIVENAGVNEVYAFGNHQTFKYMPCNDTIFTELKDHYTSFKNIAKLNGKLSQDSEQVTHVYEKYAPFFMDSSNAPEFISQLEDIELDPRMSRTDKEYAAQLLLLNMRQFEGEQNAETIFDKRKNFMVQEDPYSYYRESYQKFIDERQSATREAYGLQQGKRDGKSRYTVKVNTIDPDTYRRARFMRSKYIVPSIATANMQMLTARTKLRSMLGMHRYDQYLLMKRDWAFTNAYKKKMHIRRVNRRKTISRLFKTIDQFKWARKMKMC